MRETGPKKLKPPAVVRAMSTRDTLSAAGSFLKDQGLQVKTENDLVELIEAWSP